MNIDDIDTDVYDEVWEMPGGREAVRAELEETYQRFLANGGQVQQIIPGASGWESGFMTGAMAQSVNERNERAKRPAALADQRLSKQLGDLLAQGGTRSCDALAQQFRTTKERIRRVLRRDYPRHPVARHWLGDGRANGVSHARQHGEHEARILAYLHGLATRGAVEALSVIAKANDSTVARVRRLVGEHYQGDPLAAQWLEDGRRNGKSAATRKGVAYPKYPEEVE